MNFCSVNIRLPIWAWAVAFAAVLAACGGGNSAGQGNTDTAQTARQDTAPRKNVDLGGVDRYWNDLARWFAGMDPLPGSAIAAFDTLTAVRQHREYFSAEWNRKQEQTLNKVRHWAQQEFPREVAARGKVFYPFAGADFMYISALYPNGESYVMFGLEREGPLPDRDWLAAVDKSKLAAAFKNIEVTLNDLMNFTFFKTIDMGSDLIRTEFQGTVPILMGFIARAGYTVLKVEPVKVNPEGKVVANPSPPRRFNDFQPYDTTVTGMRIWFSGQDTNFIQNLVFWQCDISNAGLARTPHFVKYLAGYRPSVGFIKAASYLFHEANFSTFRELFVASCTHWVQDDTGLPFRMLDPTKFEITLYGNYVRPIPLFARKYQPDLREAYTSDSARVRPLPFPMGYTFQPKTSNLMRVKRKSGGQ